MTLLKTIRVLVVIILVKSLQVDSILVLRRGYDRTCDNLTHNDPNFSDEMVLGKKWRIFYTWNFPDVERECATITFKRATNMIVESVRSTMRPYLATPPDWSEATLFMKMTPMHYRSLLIPDKSNIPGRFYEVVYIAEVHAFPREAQAQKPALKTVPMYLVALKLLRGGRYLVISHCSSGFTFLTLGQEWRAKIPKPDRKEILEVAHSLNIGPGMPACILE